MRIDSLTLAAPLIALAFASPALADPITYVVKQTIGGGSVVGQIGTDGTLGTLTTTNVKTWDLTLNGVGQTYIINTANSSVQIQGNAVMATATNLSFDYSGPGSNYLLFQQGLFSGNHYWCNANVSGTCRQGATAAPISAVNDPSAQFEARTGVQVLASASGATPTPTPTPAPTPTPPPIGPIAVTTVDALNQSLTQLATSLQAQLITANLFAKILLGKNEQVSCGDCGGAGVTFGSVSFSAHGRKTLTPELSALFGFAIGHYEEKGAFISDSYTFAGGLRFDPSTMGRSRPYVEIGGAVAPGQRASYQRAYMTGAGVATGVGATRTSNMSIYARAGWVSRLTPRDELAGSVSLGHSWQTQNSYAEATGAGNPFDAQYSRGVSQTSMAGVSAQYTHLFGKRVEFAVDGTVSRSFGSHSSIGATIAGFGQANVAAGEITYFEPGARISFRVTRNVKVDAFVNATIAGQSIGTSKHGGFGINITF
ncbi:hypothetical protein U1839_23030 [Sphingomonas sp. RT2P30]|uniref:hypothetical protein n=1 Tax=Parasphingomonas halimpatiens TaxID=3096162 RepID=UPI002FC8755E